MFVSYHVVSRFIYSPILAAFFLALSEVASYPNLSASANVVYMYLEFLWAKRLLCSLVWVLMTTVFVPKYAIVPIPEKVQASYNPAAYE